MGARDRSTTADADPTLRFQKTSRRRFGRGVLPGGNKRSVLGVLALLIGGAAALPPDGLPIAVPLLVAGCYLLGYPLFAAARTR